MTTLAVSKNLVAVIVGGTSGIGQGLAETLNRQTKGNSHIVLVGRNREAADNIISRMKSDVAEGKSTGSYEFVHCDVSNSSNVKDAASTILAKYPKINFLMMSPGFLNNNRVLTEEGVDKKVAIHYYARWSFIHELLPALRSARDSNEDSKVMSVLAAGIGGKIDVKDLGFTERWSVAGVATATATYNDLMCEEFAIRNPGIVFSHSYPGGVQTNLFSSSESGLIRFISYLSPLYSLLTVSQDKCAEYLWSGLNRITASGGSAGVAGAYRIGKRGDDIGRSRYFGTPEEREALWKHTLEATKTVDV